MFYSSYVPAKGAALLRPMAKCMLAAALLMLSPWSVAQQQPYVSQENTLTLAGAIKRTLKEHPSLKVFKYRQAALGGQLQKQSLKPAYELGFEMENFAGTGDLSGIGRAEFTVSLSSVLEMGDKRSARSNVVNNRSLVMEAERKIAALNLLGEVTRNYIQVLAVQERVALAKEAVQLARETLLEVEKRFNAGVAPAAEVKRAKAALGNANLTASGEQQQLAHAKLALTMLWNETEPDFSRLDGDLFGFSADIEFTKLLAKVKHNPAIAIFASEERLTQAQLRLARSQSSADIKWSVGVKQVQDLDDTALTAGFSLPLFAPERNAGAIISAQAARDQLLADKAVTLLKLHRQLYLAYSNRKQAIFTANGLKDSIIPTLKQALDETQLAYQSGRYSYLDYLSARQELLFARRALIEAGAAALRYGSEIEQLIGEPLSAAQDATAFRHFLAPQDSLMNNFQGTAQ